MHCLYCKALIVEIRNHWFRPLVLYRFMFCPNCHTLEAQRQHIDDLFAKN